MVPTNVAGVHEGFFFLGDFQVGGDHHVDQLLEADFGLPVQGAAGREA
ncbi:MAG: hypothetical protein Q8P24_20240 [Desulfobacterales bacterium]|nr:hypothetical protein [Desulfobacterales bacterium]